MEAASPMSHNHSKQFDIVLNVLRYINSGKGSFDALAESLGMDGATINLWLKTLVPEGYLKKEKADEYTITKKGVAELRFHSLS